MARRPSQQDRIEALLAQYDPIIRAAFLESIGDIVDRARLNAIITALERGDIEAAVRATHVEPAAFLPLEMAIRQAFIEGGTVTAATMPPLREPGGPAVVFRFDVRSPGAEAWLANHSAEAITDIVDDQRLAISTKLVEGMTRGANPRATALEIVGRINPGSGRREGGVLGLTSVQERYVARARDELQSGDAKQMRHYLERGRRDKRFDAAVLRAIRAGKPVDAPTVNRIAGRYADRLLALRGETIGRTESMGALSSAQFEAYQQAVGKGTLPASAVRKGWAPPPKDKQARDNHQAMRGETVGLNERFSNGLLYPHDPSGDISETANCRCRPVFRINRLADLE